MREAQVQVRAHPARQRPPASCQGNDRILLANWLGQGADRFLAPSGGTAEQADIRGDEVTLRRPSAAFANSTDRFSDSATKPLKALKRVEYRRSSRVVEPSVSRPLRTLMIQRRHPESRHSSLVKTKRAR